MDYRQEYDKWCNDPYFDDQTREELKAIAGDDKEIEDRFYRTLEFGTAGLRGVIGAGTNRMNIYTVRQATQGLANYILAQGGQEKGVAIAHDSRLMADEFTDAAALCLAANGIKTYVFKSLRPVPELSSSNFMQRSFGERVAMNAPIQGTAADIIKIAMIRVHDRLLEEHLKSRLIITVHDELLIETAEDEIDRVKEILTEGMQQAADLKVALAIDLHTGKNWYEAK